MTPALQRHVREAREAFRARSDQLFQYKLEMTRLPTGLRGLWHRLTGKYQEVRAGNELEANTTRIRHGAERQSLIDAQRAVLQTRFKELRSAQAGQLASLRQEMGRYLKFTRGDVARPPARAFPQAQARTLASKGDQYHVLQ